MFHVEQNNKKISLPFLTHFALHGARLFFMDDKMLSRCCESDVIVFDTYYQCLKCFRPCDMLSSIRSMGREINDNRMCRASISDNEIKKLHVE